MRYRSAAATISHYRLIPRFTEPIVAHALPWIERGKWPRAPIVAGDTRVVYGSRFMNGGARGPWMSTAANRFLTGVTNVLFGASLTDMETCYKIMRTDVARSLRLEANRFDIEPQITARLLRAGHRVTELPVRFEARTRRQGKKIGWRDGVQALNVLVAERLRRTR